MLTEYWKGIVDFTNFTRNSFRLSSDTRVNDKLKISGSANCINSNRTYVLQRQDVTENNVIGATGGGTMQAVMVPNMDYLWK